MSQTLAIAGRELAERRFVFIAATAFALLAVLLPLAPGLHGSPRDVITVASSIFAAVFAVALAAILGATIVGRDLGAGRLAFYFARPVGAAAIWFGKLAAAAVMTGLSFAIIIVPALIATSKRQDTGVYFAGVALSCALFFFAAHAMSTMIRSRSVLIGADFAAAVAAAAILWMLARPLLRAILALRALAIGFGVALFVIFVAAGAWQLIDGRIDRRRSHAAFSAAFWIGIAAALALAAAFTGWIVSATPRDLARLARVEPSRRGDWVVVGGLARHRLDYEPTFLINAENGETKRVDVFRSVFSADGSKFLALVPHRGEPADLVVGDSATGRTTETDIAVDLRDFRLAALDDISRVAVVNDGLLNVYDTRARRSVASARLPVWPDAIYFASPDVVRMYAVRQGLSAYEFDAAHRSLQRTGAAGGRMTRMHVSPDGTRVATFEARKVVVRDARTLQPLAEYDESRLLFTHDGGIVTASSPRGRVVVRAGGKEIDAGPGWPSAIRELGGGKLAVSIGHEATRAIAIIDAERGVVVRREEGLTLPPQLIGTMFDPRALQWSPNLIVLRGNAVLRWNALTGEKKVLVPG